MSNKKPRYAVVVVHGIGSGTQDAKAGFSRDLKSGVVRCNPECAKLWFEAPWEGLNDSVDKVVKDVVDELFDSYIKDAGEEIRRTEEWAAQQDLSESCKIVRWFKTCIIWLRKTFSNVMPSALQTAKEVSPRVLDAILDLPIYLGHDQSKVIKESVVKKIDEAMECGVDGIVLVGHSLGSVIAFDVLMEELQSRGDPRIKALVTMGSPLEWVVKIRHELSRISVPASFDVKGTRWVNYFDPQDPVPIRRALNADVFKGVENVKEVSKKTLIDSHCAYWKSPRIAEKIAELMCKMP